MKTPEGKNYYQEQGRAGSKPVARAAIKDFSFFHIWFMTVLLSVSDMLQIVHKGE